MVNPELLRLEHTNPVVAVALAAHRRGLPYERALEAMVLALAEGNERLHKMAVNALAQERVVYLVPLNGVEGPS